LVDVGAGRRNKKEAADAEPENTNHRLLKRMNVIFQFGTLEV
jgi:hypothetical protein